MALFLAIDLTDRPGPTTAAASVDLVVASGVGAIVLLAALGSMSH